MRVVRQAAEVPREAGPVALAAGFLDGIHVGHRRVIAAAQARARAVGGQAWVLSFDPHPLRVLRPATAPPLITPLPMKLRILEGLGVDGCLLREFTPEFARLEPEQFVAELAGQLPGLAGIAVGAGWRFGHRGAGDAALLSRLAARHGFAVDLVPPVEADGAPVSSTRVRQAVAAGDMAAAAGLLGRWFSVEGTVEPGRRVGRELGFPTANVDALRELHPPPGVYAVHVTHGRGRGGGAAYIGSRPTYGAGGHAVLEVFLFDFEGDLYGQEIEVAFLARLRGDEAFPDVAALRAQIARDVDRARALVADDSGELGGCPGFR
jgi:riboflavin kinase/FMN adenylyltransferase